MKQPRSKRGRFTQLVDDEAVLVAIAEMKPKGAGELVDPDRPGWKRANIFRVVKRLRRQGFLRRRPSMALTDEGMVVVEGVWLDRDAKVDLP